MKKYLSVVICIFMLFSALVVPSQAAETECDHKPYAHQEIEYVGRTAEYCNLWRLISVTRCDCGKVKVTSSVINPDYAHISHYFIKSDDGNGEVCTGCGYTRP